MRGFAGTAGAGVGLPPANFFAACFASPNFCQSNRPGAGCRPAGFCFWSALSWPFNWRSEKGTRIFGATKRVCTKTTAARKVATPERSKIKRSRGQRFPPGSENTKGGRLSRGSSCMSRLFSLTTPEIKGAKKRGQRLTAVPPGDARFRAGFRLRVSCFPRRSSLRAR